MEQKKIVYEAFQIIIVSRVISQSFARAEKQKKGKKARGINNNISKYSHPRNKLLALQQRENYPGKFLIATQSMQKMFCCAKISALLWNQPKNQKMFLQFRDTFREDLTCYVEVHNSLTDFNKNVCSVHCLRTCPHGLLRKNLKIKRATITDNFLFRGGKSRDYRQVIGC